MHPGFTGRMPEQRPHADLVCRAFAGIEPEEEFTVFHLGSKRHESFGRRGEFNATGSFDADDAQKGLGVTEHGGNRNASHRIGTMWAADLFSARFIACEEVDLVGVSGLEG